MKTFCSLAGLGLLVDTAVPIPGSMVDAAGRLTLDGVLVAGVIALWRALAARETAYAATIAAKDAQLIAMATKVTEVMTQVLEAVKELRSSVDELREEHGQPQRSRVRA